MNNKVIAFKSVFLNKKRMMFLLYSDGTEEIINYSEEKEIKYLVELGFEDSKESYENKQLSKIALFISVTFLAFLIPSALELFPLGIALSASVFSIGGVSLCLNTPSFKKKIKMQYDEILKSYKEVGNLDVRNKEIEELNNKKDIESINAVNSCYQSKIDQINSQIDKLNKERTILINKCNENKIKIKTINEHNK